MKKPVSFKITEDHEFEEEEEEIPVRGGASCAVDPVLYSMMKDLRKRLSKRLEVPPLLSSKIHPWRQWLLPIRSHWKNYRTYRV